MVEKPYVVCGGGARLPRRDFLKSTGLTVAGAGTLVGLAGCTPMKNSDRGRFSHAAGSQTLDHSQMNATSLNITAAPSVYHHPLGGGVSAGGVDLYLISDGTFEIPVGAISPNMGEQAAKDWLAGKAMGSDEVTNPLNVVLVRTADRLVLIDTGLGAIDFFGDRTGKMFERLAASGVKPTDITDVAITHCHGDHVGGALMALEQKLFSDSVRVHVSQAEADFWQSDTTEMFQTYLPGEEMGAGMTESARAFFNGYKANLNTFADGDEIVTGVTAMLTPGHTPGHAAFRVQGGREEAIFLGDCANASQLENPAWHFFFDTEPAKAAATRAELLKTIAANNTLLCATHVSFPSLGRLTAAGEGYQFNPVTWVH